MAKEYEISVIDSDEPALWQRLCLTEQWGTAEPYYPPGRDEQVGLNRVRVTVADEHVDRFEKALERDNDVLQYNEVE